MSCLGIWFRELHVRKEDEKELVIPFVNLVLFNWKINLQEFPLFRVISFMTMGTLR